MVSYVECALHYVPDTVFLNVTNVERMRNNHPLLGICCKYKQHPIGIRQRIAILLGSISFGIAVSNIIYLYYKMNPEDNVLLLTVRSWNYTRFEITSEMALLWTVGSVVHTMMDLLVWNISVCSCCLPGAFCSCCGCFRKLGQCMVIVICVLFCAMALLATLLRVHYDGQGYADEGTVSQDTSSTTSTPSLDGLLANATIESFSFLLGYFIELSLVYFVYFPICATIVFSGIIPCIGRPRDVKRRSKKKMRKENNNDDDVTPLVI